MSQELITERSFVAARRYIDALDSLGFSPEGVMWAIAKSEPENNDIRQAKLIMITSLFDKVGPLRMFEVLFEAYNKAKVPTEIDPWVVELFSTKMKIGDYLVRDDWILRLPEQKSKSSYSSSISSSMKVVREWRRFEEAVAA